MFMRHPSLRLSLSCLLWVRKTFVMPLVMTMKLQAGVLPPAVGKNVTVRNESLNQTTAAFNLCLQSNRDSSFDSVSGRYHLKSVNPSGFLQTPSCERTIWRPTYWEARKRIEMATGHVTPLKLSRSSQRPPWAAIKSGYISCLSNLDPVT